MWTRHPLSLPQSSTVILMRLLISAILRPNCYHFLITQVLHVAFSHSGDHFVTCSKDSKVLVWHIAAPDHEVKLKATIDMNKEKVQPPRNLIFIFFFCVQDWINTWGAHFNKTDSLLFVAGNINEVIQIYPRHLQYAKLAYTCPCHH